MQILFVSSMEGCAWGGSEELWSSAARALLESKCAVGVSTCNWTPIPSKVQGLAELGATLYSRNWHTLGSRILRKLRDPIHALLSRAKPELVVISQGNNSDGLPWMEHCLQEGIKYATVAQAALPWYWPNDQTIARLRAVYLSARRVYFVSHANLRLTELQLACDLGHATVIRNPFNVPYDIELPWPHQNREARLACVARLEGYVKGHDILFEVLSLEKWRRRPLRVTLYGAGPNAASFRTICNRMQLDNVSFAGFVDDPVEIWRNEHCLVLPSRAEGLPLALVETMLCARPCIVSDASGNPELLEDNTTGFVSRGGTAEGLDEAMERAWQARSRWEQIGAVAAAAVRRAIPRDPAAVLAADLLQLLN